MTPVFSRFPKPSLQNFQPYCTQLEKRAHHKNEPTILTMKTRQTNSEAKCTIKIFRGGAGVVTPSNPPPLTNNYPPPVLRCFWKDPLMTPHPPPPHFKHPSPLPPPHPPPLPPLKILIIRKAPDDLSYQK